MVALANALLFPGGFGGTSMPANNSCIGKSGCQKYRSQFPGVFHSNKVQYLFGRKQYYPRNQELFHRIKCVKKDGQFDPSSIEPPPYYSYMDSASGQLEPASGARASIPGQDYWPEGTVSRVRAARAPEPVGKSEGKPSFGKTPGSRRKKYKGQATTSEIVKLVQTIPALPCLRTQLIFLEDPKDLSEEFVVYQTEAEEENLSSHQLDKRLGRPHPFIDPTVEKLIEEPRSSEELWWNWHKPEKEQWSRWQRRRPDVDTVFAKSMAETGQIKLYRDHPTLTESALARARRHIFKKERLQAEQRKLEELGPMAYCSEWVKAWDVDTSHEAVQKHYEETGEDENAQLITTNIKPMKNTHHDGH